MRIHDIVYGVFILISLLFLYRYVLPSPCYLDTVFYVTCYSSCNLSTSGTVFDGIIQLDSSFKPGRDGQLKSRLGEAVREESPD